MATSEDIRHDRGPRMSSMSEAERTDCRMVRRDGELGCSALVYADDNQIEHNALQSSELSVELLFV